MKFINTVLGFALLSLATAILPNKCSVEHCGTNGALARCTQTSPFKVTNCAAWATTTEAVIQCKKLDCRFQSCYLIPLLASDGNTYCTPCHIHQVSCRTGFKVFGPVDGALSRQVSEDVEDVEDSSVEEEVSREVEEQSDDVETVSRAIRPTPFCSMRFCTKRGALARCRVPFPQGGSAITSCFRFSFLPQSQEQCRFFCTQDCLPEDIQPIANNGKKFCNECLLRLESCRTRYKVFGPEDLPGNPPPNVSVRPIPTPLPNVAHTCSVPFCTFAGRSARCVFDEKLTNCAEYAKTDDKKKACEFACIQICVDPDSAPVDNFGKKYCSVCHLMQASCASDFKIFLAKN